MALEGTEVPEDDSSVRVSPGDGLSHGGGASAKLSHCLPLSLAATSPDPSGGLFAVCASGAADSCSEAVHLGRSGSVGPHMFKAGFDCGGTPHRAVRHRSVAAFFCSFKATDTIQGFVRRSCPHALSPPP